MGRSVVVAVYQWQAGPVSLKDGKLLWDDNDKGHHHCANLMVPGRPAKWKTNPKLGKQDLRCV